MRGWVLLAMARAGVSDDALIFVLEELDTGVDAYLVAAAARALRSYPASDCGSCSVRDARARQHSLSRRADVVRELMANTQSSPTGTSAVCELLATLWPGSVRTRAAVLPELEPLRAPNGGLPRKLRIDVERALQAIRGPAPGR